MAENFKHLIESLQDGEWLILSKNSLFWKARLDPSDQSKGSILSISYGKSLCQALKAETSQAFEHPTREKAMTALNKLVKEKAKNGYSLYTEAVEEKENRPDHKFGKASPIPIKGGKIDVEAIEHQCQHIPLILTEDFEEKIIARTAEKARDQSDANLGKRQKSTDAKKARIEDVEHSHPAAMSLTEILNKPSNSKRAASRNTTAHKEQEQKPVENTPMKEEVIIKSSSKVDSVKSKLSYKEKQDSNAKQTSQTEEEKVNQSVNALLERKVTGSDLYGVHNNTKHFTVQVLVQATDQWVFLDYSVAEDISINKKLLLKWTSNDDAALAAQKQISALQEGGYKISNFEPPALISFGTISTLSQKAQMFQDCLDIHPSQITDVSQAVLGHHSADESEEEAEEKKTEKQVVAANLEIDQLSHSVATLNDESVKELALADFDSESIAERTKEYERFRDENERGTLMAPNKHVQPLGPSAPGMIAVMLLNPYKNMDVSSSCF